MTRAVAVLAGLLVVLAGSVQAGAWRPLDVAVVRAAALAAPCAVLQTGWAISPWLSAQATVAGTAALTLGLGWKTRRWSSAWLLAGLAATGPIELALKHMVDQPPPKAVPETAAARRPECGKERYPLPSVETPSSFPSGSVTRLTYLSALAVAAASRRRRLRTAAGVLIAVVFLAAALSRLPIRWHWPSDLLGGTLLGTAAALAALHAMRASWPRAAL